MSDTATPAPTTTPKRVGRKRQVVASVTALAIVGAGLAYAAVQSQLAMRGNLGNGQFAALYGAKIGSNIGQLQNPEGVYLAPLQGKNADLVPTLVFKPADGSEAYKALDLTGVANTTVYETESLVIEVSPVINGNRQGYVSGLTGSVPAGWKAEIMKPAKHAGSVDGGCNMLVKNTIGTEDRLGIRFTNTGATAPLDLSKLSVVVTALPNGSISAPSGTVCSPLVGSAG